jgi:hypothetical protein
VSARIWNAVKSLGVPNPVGSSQSTPTALLAVSGSAIARALKSGSSQARATRRAAGVGPICSANSVKRRCSSAVKMPFSMHSSRRAISRHLEVGDLLDHRLHGAVVVMVVVVHRCPFARRRR